MATAAGEWQRALSYLHSLELMIGDLPAVASDWDDLSEGERESWSHDWDNEMAALHCLADSVARGVLTGSDLDRYAAVVRRLHDLSPLTVRLGLQQPLAPERR